MSRLQSIRSRVPVLSVVLVLSLILPDVAWAASVRLTEATTANVTSFKISPDGRYVVYETRDYNVGAWSLYSVPLGGGASVQLANVDAAAMAEWGSGYPEYYITPDSTYVIYGLPHTGNSPELDLWSVPIAGPTGVSARLGRASASYFHRAPTFSVSVTPEEVAVVYVHMEHGAGTALGELFAAPVTGPLEARRKLSLTDQSVDFFAVAPDGHSVIYRATLPDRNQVLNRVPIAGPAESAERLDYFTPSTVLDKGVISPDGRYLVYGLRSPGFSWAELRSVPLDSAQPVPVALRPADPEGGMFEYFQVSPDGSRVVYVDPLAPRRLFSVPIGGPAADAVALTPAFPRHTAAVTWWLLSPDGAKVVYGVGTQSEGYALSHVHMVPIEGPADASVEIGEFQSREMWFGQRISSDGRHLVLQGDSPDGVFRRLHSLPLEGPPFDRVVLAEHLITSNNDYYITTLSPDSTKVLFRETRDPQFMGQIYVVPIEGPADAALEMNGPLAAWAWTTQAEFAPDSTRVVYLTQQLGDGANNVYVADDGKAQVGFAASAISAAENAGTVRIPIRLSQASVLPVTVQVTTESHSEMPAEGHGVDYWFESDTVTFSPGETVRMLTIHLVDDGISEPVETILLALTGPENAALSGASRLWVRIADRLTYLPVVEQ